MTMRGAATATDCATSAQANSARADDCRLYGATAHPSPLSRVRLEPAGGIEPPTCRLQGGCSAS